jgi:hypothetical protein
LELTLDKPEQVKKYFADLGATNIPDVLMPPPKFNLKISNGRVVLAVAWFIALWA